VTSTREVSLCTAGQHLRVGHVEEAERLVKRFHYSRRMPSNIQCVATWHREGGLFGDFGEAYAACIFSIPPTRWSEDLLELARLVRHPDAQCSLTGLIASAAKFINRTKQADLLVSFADATQGHHGGIYQAASWNYDGQRDAVMDGLIVDGAFVSGRSCNSRWGTRSPEKLRGVLKHSVIEPHYDAGKHLYWKALSRSGAKKAERLGLKAMPYPKPGAA